MIYIPGGGETPSGLTILINCRLYLFGITKLGSCCLDHLSNINTPCKTWSFEWLSQAVNGYPAHKYQPGPLPAGVTNAGI